MYWIFLIIFTITVLIPDLVRNNIFFLSETRAEEIAIFLMGAITFIIILKNEQQILFHKKEKEKDEKRIEQTVKDLVESYSYIGEVNRKMDILMGIALGLSDRTVLSKTHENETYASIVNAANSLLKADFTSLKFVNTKTLRTSREFVPEGRESVKNAVLVSMKENVHIKKQRDFLVVSSNQEVKGIKSYLVIHNYNTEEESNPKNMEILKVFASQALFLYSFAHSSHGEA
ncbi:MAG: hypothetical protein WC022_02590 [Parcubacteria group bacterium]